MFPLLFAVLFYALPAFALPSSLLERQSGCSCGYSLSQYGSAYFRKELIADFSAATSGTADSSSWLSSYGFYIADGYPVSATAADGTVPQGSYRNVRINNGVLELVVPGGQVANGGTTSNAQIEGPSGIRNGVFTMKAKIDATVGTCQSIFTYHDQGSGTQDEQDIEILGAYLYQTGDNGTPPGIELTNWDPSDPDNRRNDNRIDVFTQDPAAGFHDYTIAWLPQKTTYYMDSTALDSPTQYYSVNPSGFVINHWTNGDPAFTQGPPTKEAVLQVQKVTAYYSLSGETGLPSGCTQADVCVV